MLSSAILYLTPKPLPSFRFRQIPMLKDPILISGLCSRRVLGNSLKVPDHWGMTELTKMDAFREQEDDVLLGDGSAENGWGALACRDVESFLNRMSKWLAAAFFGTIILWKHDSGAMWAAMGSVVNSWLSFSLKRILNHQRPVSALRSDPGMPSSHAQSIFYIAVYAICSLVDWMGMNTFTLMVGTVILICGSYFGILTEQLNHDRFQRSWLRISQKLHTVSQVLVGAAIGSTFSITWFWLWQSIMLSTFESSVWLQIVLTLGTLAFCISFVIFVIQNWLMDEQ